MVNKYDGYINSKYYFYNLTTPKNIKSKTTNEMVDIIVQLNQIETSLTSAKGKITAYYNSPECSQFRKWWDSAFYLLGGIDSKIQQVKEQRKQVEAKLPVFKKAKLDTKDKERIEQSLEALLPKMGIPTSLLPLILSEFLKRLGALPKKKGIYKEGIYFQAAAFLFYLNRMYMRADMKEQLKKDTKPLLKTADHLQTELNKTELNLRHLYEDESQQLKLNPPDLSGLNVDDLVAMVYHARPTGENGVFTEQDIVDAVRGVRLTTY